MVFLPWSCRSSKTDLGVLKRSTSKMSTSDGASGPLASTEMLFLMTICHLAATAGCQTSTAGSLTGMVTPAARPASERERAPSMLGCAQDIKSNRKI
jgi:hypothetical protein